MEFCYADELRLQAFLVCDNGTQRFLTPWSFCNSLAMDWASSCSSTATLYCWSCSSIWHWANCSREKVVCLATDPHCFPGIVILNTWNFLELTNEMQQWSGQLENEKELLMFRRCEIIKESNCKSRENIKRTLLVLWSIKSTLIWSIKCTTLVFLISKVTSLVSKISIVPYRFLNNWNYPTSFQNMFPSF